MKKEGYIKYKVYIYDIFTQSLVKIDESKKIVINDLFKRLRELSEIINNDLPIIIINELRDRLDKGEKTKTKQTKIIIEFKLNGKKHIEKFENSFDVILSEIKLFESMPMLKVIEKMYKK